MIKQAIPVLYKVIIERHLYICLFSLRCTELQSILNPYTLITGGQLTDKHLKALRLLYSLNAQYGDYFSALNFLIIVNLVQTCHCEGEKRATCVSYLKQG